MLKCQDKRCVAVGIEEAEYAALCEEREPVPSLYATIEFLDGCCSAFANAFMLRRAEIRRQRRLCN